MSNLPGYDAWKLASPEDERDGPCPFCGAYSTRSCELEEETGCCPWEESEPDPDALREARDERKALED